MDEEQFPAEHLEQIGQLSHKPGMGGCDYGGMHESSECDARFGDIQLWFFDLKFAQSQATN